MTSGDQIYRQTNLNQGDAMNATTILNKIMTLVSFKMHKGRKEALLACIQSVLKGSSITVTEIGRGITNKAYEKHRIKRADRLLSNPHLALESPLFYSAICKLFCTSAQPVIAVDWSDLDKSNCHFLLRAALTVKGRTITLYQEVHTLKTKEKASTHKDFLKQLKQIMPAHCTPIIVTDAGYKSPWFQAVRALGWDVVGRVRKPHLYSLNEGKTWSPIVQLYEKATRRAKQFDNVMISRKSPFRCSLVLIKQESKGRHALNVNRERRRSRASLKQAKGATDPWLLATTLPSHRNLAKQVIAIYKQRMQIEEGFRDMKSRQFGLGFEQNRSVKTFRVSNLVFIATLASLIALLIGMAVTRSNIHRRFQANTTATPSLSFHTLGLRALAVNLKIPRKLWKQTLLWLHELTNQTSHVDAWH